MLEPVLVALAMNRIEALRAEAKIHWLISQVRPKPKKPATQQPRKAFPRTA